LDYPRVIAVTAPSRRSGKGTITDVLVQEYGYTEVMFAMPLKVMYIALLMYQGVDQAHYPAILDGYLKETPMEEVGGLSLRSFAEGVGTDWGRNMIDKDIWVKMASFKIKKMLDLGHRVVISDVRFPNECDVARQYGGKVWSVIRPEENGGLAPTLASEGHLKFYTFDAVFSNAGDVEDLKQLVRIAMGPQ
jgi:deoxynucleotide monophosphate kinase-like protein